MITWMNFLHLYQPPTQSEEVLRCVVRESYAPLVQLMQKYSQVRWTIHISGSLLELLERYGYQKLIEEYVEMARSGRIEFVGGAMYHPILPLLPPTEVRRQIDLQRNISERFLGDAYRPVGFFLPEMTYSASLAEILQSSGFEWLLLDDIHHPSGRSQSGVKYRIRESALSVLFRNREVSKTFPPEHLVRETDQLDGQSLLVAHDGELYGHWHREDYGYYEKAFRNENFTFRTISEYLKTLQKESEIVPREASWESTEEEIRKKVPFALWDNPENSIHRDLWALARKAFEMVSQYKDDTSFAMARSHMDRGWASCAWWWASGAKLSAFSPICWNPTEIEKGANEWLSAVQSLDTLPSEERVAFEKLFKDFSQKVWKIHWKQEKEKPPRVSEAF